MSRKKRVLWLSHMVPYPPKGGLLQRSYNLLKEISKSHEVVLLAFNQNRLLESSFVGETDPLGISVRKLGSLCEEVHIVDIPSETSEFQSIICKLYSLVSKDSYTVNWLKSREYSKLVLATLSRLNFDVIFVDTVSLLQFVPAKISDPCILNHHNIEGVMMRERAKEENNLVKKAYFWVEAQKLMSYENKYVKRVAYNTVCSEEDAELLEREYGATNVKSIPNGVDVDYFSRKALNEREPDTVIFAGGLSWYPNLDAMRYFTGSVWPKLKERNKKVKMLLVGRNPPQEFKKLSSGDFNVTGFVDDVRPYMEAASCYVCPIRTGGGTKLKVLDAMAMGVPLVAHPFSCVGIPVKDEKHVLFAETPEEFVAQIQRVLTDSDLASRLAANGRQLVVEEFSFKTIGKRLSDLFFSL
ncbi:glycosyltransferase [Marinobacter salicampi]|uniref:glycosyltransferase n=1 Tax=Marinobacter salicampi TaxID=435907 RepID=UPI00140AC03F|nr:glycosyltransferase [Marinobacter salicampi]